MPETTKPGGAPNWSMLPFKRFLAYLDESHRLLRLSVRGVKGLIGMVGLAEAIAAVDESEGRARDEDQIKQIREDAKFAQNEVDGGFRLLYAHAVVGLWGAVEVLFEDVVVAWLLNVPSLLDQRSFRKIRVPGAQLISLDKEEQMRLLVGEWERSQAVSQKRGVDRFEAMLAPLGIGGSADKEIKQAVLEMYHVRNVIVHRGAKADVRLIEECGWMKIRIGEMIPVNEEAYDRYSRALTNYVVSIVHCVGGRFSTARTGAEDAK